MVQRSSSFWSEGLIDLVWLAEKPKRLRDAAPLFARVILGIGLFSMSYGLVYQRMPVEWLIGTLTALVSGIALHYLTFYLLKWKRRNDGTRLDPAPPSRE